MLDTETDNAQTPVKKNVARKEQHRHHEAPVAPVVDSVSHRSSRRPNHVASHTVKLQDDTDTGRENTTQPAAIGPAATGPVDPTDLSLGTFREVEWSNADLTGYDAHGADFGAAILRGISALGANFADSSFEEAQLQNAAFCGANLTGSNLRHTNLRNANLAWADLRGATLFAADLRGANLAWADLRNVDLREANLAGAFYNYQTRWPADFEPGGRALIAIAEPR